jgi:hypothetical protein
MKPFHPIYANDRGLAHFICLMEQSITCHDPSDEKPMFFKTKEAVFRTGGIHGTGFAIDWRNVVPVDSDEGAKRVKRTACLPVRSFLSTILCPRPSERFTICAAGKATNEKQKGYARKKAASSHGMGRNCSRLRGFVPKKTPGFNELEAFRNVSSRAQGQ